MKATRDRISRIINRVGDKNPYIQRSSVEQVGLINPRSLVLNSRLIGRVMTQVGTKIIDATISGKVSFGRWTTFNGPNSDIFTQINEVKIGNFCSIARQVSIQEYDHRVDRITSYFVLANLFGETVRDEITSSGAIVIGNDVWIGTQCVILSGAVISNGAVIGANSVVNSFIPPYAIAVGSPARVVRYRFPEAIIEKLQSLQWWEWSEEKIRQNREFFSRPLTEATFEALV